MLRIKGKLVAAGGRLTSSGPESGIVDGESPSISLSYIDKTDYKHAHMYVYSVSTESVSQQIGSCLMARYLSSTVEPLNSCRPNASLPLPATHVPSRSQVKTQLNNFSLFWLYDEGSLPINDPDTEESLDTTGFSSMPWENFTNGSKDTTWPSNPFYPYPNETSLLLGDWYWNYGHQKSQNSFKKLVDIIGHPGYHPDDE